MHPSPNSPKKSIINTASKQGHHVDHAASHSTGKNIALMATGKKLYAFGSPDAGLKVLSAASAR